jgi:hypothetical protein
MNPTFRTFSIDHLSDVSFAHVTYSSLLNRFFFSKVFEIKCFNINLYLLRRSTMKPKVTLQIQRHEDISGNGGIAPHTFLISAPAVGKYTISRLGRFTPDTHWIGGWLGPSIDLGSSLPPRDLKPGHPARSLVPILTELSSLPIVLYLILHFLHVR